MKTFPAASGSPDNTCHSQKSLMYTPIGYFDAGKIYHPGVYFVKRKRMTRACSYGRFRGPDLQIYDAVPFCAHLW